MIITCNVFRNMLLYQYNKRKIKNMKKSIKFLKECAIVAVLLSPIIYAVYSVFLNI